MKAGLRSMTDRDYDDVRAVWQCVDGIGECLTRDQLERFLSRNPALSQVACLDDRVVGVVLCGHDSHRGYLYRLAVVPDYRRSGIATALVKECLLRLTQLEIPRCSVHLFDTNRDGAAFWSAMGWRKRDDVAAYSYDLEVHAS